MTIQTMSGKVETGRAFFLRPFHAYPRLSCTHLDLLSKVESKVEYS